MHLTLIYLVVSAGFAAASERLLQHNPVDPSKTVDNSHSPMLFKGKYTMGRASLGCGLHETQRPCAGNEMDPFAFAYEMCEQGDAVCSEAIALAVKVQAQLDQEMAMHAAKAQQAPGDIAPLSADADADARFDPERALAAAKGAAVKEATAKEASAKQSHVDPQE